MRTMTSALRPARSRRCAAPGLDWLLMGAAWAWSSIGTLLVWSATSTRADLTGGDATAYLRKQLVNVAIGVVLMVMVLATDHRWVRILAPLVYVGSIVGLSACSSRAAPSTAPARGSSSAACRSSRRSSPSWPW